MPHARTGRTHPLRIATVALGAAMRDVRAARSGAIENEMQRRHVLVARTEED